MVGRLLQLAGMVILPIGLWIGLVRGEVRLEVKLLAIGGCVYLIGYLLHRKSD